MYKGDVRFEKVEEGNRQHQPQTSAAYFSITTVTITIVTTTTIIIIHKPFYMSQAYW